MKRYLVHFLTFLSMLLFLASAVLWVRSYWHWDNCAFYQDRDAVNFLWSRGEFTMLRAKSIRNGTMLIWLQKRAAPPRSHWSQVRPTYFLAPITGELRFWTEYWDGAAPVFQFAGFGFFHNQSTWAQYTPYAPQAIGWAFDIPDWFLILFFGILPALRIRFWIRHRRRPDPLKCTHCGYDLRATPDRCPECGTPRAA